MRNIVLLDDLTINKIAAGEVIENPASIVKEMVENSIDAGATKINIETKKGGISYIKIVDNGIGIRTDDVDLAFERHATSKIRSAKDLDSVSSMGFRGEALASIASVAKVTLKTRAKDEEIGTCAIVYDGQIQKKEEIAFAYGTQIEVEDLFYNVPARYKFLKRDATEQGYIFDVLTNIALIHPEIAIKYTNQGKKVLQTNGSGNLRDVVYQIFGSSISNAMIDMDYTYDRIHVYGLIGKPEIARSNRTKQIYFVNNRVIKDATIMQAIMQSYKGIIPIGKYAQVIIGIKIDNLDIDVNVHPAKLEVRFSNPNLVFQAVYHSIKNTLLKENLIADISKSDEKNNDKQRLDDNMKIKKDLFGKSKSDEIKDYVEQESKIKTNSYELNETDDDFSKTSAQNILEELKNLRKGLNSEIETLKDNERKKHFTYKPDKKLSSLDIKLGQKKQEEKVDNDIIDEEIVKKDIEELTNSSNIEEQLENPILDGVKEDIKNEIEEIKEIEKIDEIEKIEDIKFDDAKQLTNQLSDDITNINNIDDEEQTIENLKDENIAQEETLDDIDENLRNINKDIENLKKQLLKSTSQIKKLDINKEPQIKHYNNLGSSITRYSKVDNLDKAQDESQNTNQIEKENIISNDEIKNDENLSNQVLNIQEENNQNEIDKNENNLVSLDLQKEIKDEDEQVEEKEKEEEEKEEKEENDKNKESKEDFLNNNYSLEKKENNLKIELKNLSDIDNQIKQENEDNEKNQDEIELPKALTQSREEITKKVDEYIKNAKQTKYDKYIEEYYNKKEKYDKLLKEEKQTPKTGNSLTNLIHEKEDINKNLNLAKQEEEQELKEKEQKEKEDNLNQKIDEKLDEVKRPSSASEIDEYLKKYKEDSRNRAIKKEEIAISKEQDAPLNNSIATYEVSIDGKQKNDSLDAITDYNKDKYLNFTTPTIKDRAHNIMKIDEEEARKKKLQDDEFNLKSNRILVDQKEKQDEKLDSQTDEKNELEIEKEEEDSLENTPKKLDLKNEIEQKEEKLKFLDDEIKNIEKNPDKISEDFIAKYEKMFGTKIKTDEQIRREQKAKDEEQKQKGSDLIKNISLFDDEPVKKTIDYKIVGVFFKTYIMIEIDDEVYIIDQHAAHERINYEKVKENFYSKDNKDSQMLLMPDIIELTQKEYDIAKDNWYLFEKAGFTLEEFGTNTIKLTGCPDMCIKLDTKNLFFEILDEINTVARTAKQEIEEKLIATIACKASIKANMVISNDEIKELLDTLLGLPNPFSCPHGRPTAIKMSKGEIEKKFSRT